MFRSSMRKGLRAVAALALCCAMPAAAQVPAPQRLLLKHVTLIDGTGSVQKDVDIRTLVGKIEEIGKDLKENDDGERIVDLTGKYVIPGLIDSRVQIGASPANKILRAEFGNEQRIAWFHSMVRLGVTSARLIQSDLSEQTDFKHWRDLEQLNGPTIIPSGPTFTVENGLPAVEYGIAALMTRERETSEVRDEDTARDMSRKLAHSGGEVFEVGYHSGPAGDIPVLTDIELATIIKEAHGHELKVFCWVGRNKEVANAIAQGCDVIEGVTEEKLNDEMLSLMAKKKIPFLPALVYQGYAIVHFIQPDSLKAYLADPEVGASLSPVIRESLDAESGQLINVRSVMNVPVNATVQELNRARLSHGADVKLQDPTKPREPTFQESYQQEYERAVDNVKRAKAAGVPIITGTGAGSVLVFPGPSEHLELKLLVDSGLSPMDAIVAATRDAAAALGVDKDTGTIQKGKNADFVVLDADPLADISNTMKINAVVRRGWVINRDKMDRY
jgi:imidazolonepropionase-like amidohydrolase